MRFAIKNLLRRGVRSALSVLGVAVGVAAIVAFTAMGEGFKVSIDKYGRQSGADLVLVEDNAGDPAFGRILEEELDAMRAHSDIRSVAGSIVMPATVPGRSAPLFVAGRDPDEDLILVYRNPALRGRLLETEDEILVGAIAAQELGLDLGDSMELLRRSFIVVGVYESSVQWENGGIVAHSNVLRSQLTMPPGSVMVAFLYLEEESDVALVTLDLQSQFPHLRVLPTAFLSAGFEQLAYIDSFIWVISLAALLVGAIGVLNTMLMTVSERTREIGTLRAFGWRSSMVMRLILAEGLVTALVGGLCGSALGWVAAELLMRLVPQGLLEAHYSPAVFLRGMAIALVVGILGALYPAWRASRLLPAEALRYE